MTVDFAAAEGFDRGGWRQALGALRRLMADADDTTQVFCIMSALNQRSTRAGYARLLDTAEGGRIAYRRIELAPLLSDPAYVAQFPAGSIGAAYAAFLLETGYSADGLAAVSRTANAGRDAQHPVTWYGRRTRDLHDIWHVLTGYQADDPLGEACLVAFSFAQTRGLGWALIAAGGMVKGMRSPLGVKAVKAIWEGYRHGRSARWLPGEDVDSLLAEPLKAARIRLRIAEPTAYLTCRN